MTTRHEIIQTLQKRKEELMSKYHLSQLGIFGSYARDSQTPSSDLDLLVEFEAGTQELYDLKRDLKEELSAEFLLPVDICRLKYIKPAFRSLIMQDAIFV